MARKFARFFIHRTLWVMIGSRQGLQFITHSMFVYINTTQDINIKNLIHIISAKNCIETQRVIDFLIPNIMD